MLYLYVSVVVHICNPCTLEADSGGSLCVWGQSGIKSEVRQARDAHLDPGSDRQKNKKGWWDGAVNKVPATQAWVLCFDPLEPT